MIFLVLVLIMIWYMYYRVEDRSRISPIVDHLWLSDWPTATNEYLLRKHNIKCVISLNRRRKSHDEQMMYRRLGIESYEFVIDDHPRAPILLVLPVIYRLIEEQKKKGAQTLVHCTAGVSRSPSVVVYYLMKNKQMRYKDAYQLVRSRRRVVDINPGFKNQLSQSESPRVQY